ncbi:MAG: hypothetical protein U9R68_07305, partial [Planctomycetota bacterium]|nr:hypothetical protein [Planctomycetota bacterium]
MANLIAPRHGRSVIQPALSDLPCAPLEDMKWLHEPLRRDDHGNGRNEQHTARPEQHGEDTPPARFTNGPFGLGQFNHMGRHVFPRLSAQGGSQRMDFFAVASQEHLNAFSA